MGCNGSAGILAAPVLQERDPCAPPPPLLSAISCLVARSAFLFSIGYSPEKDQVVRGGGDEEKRGSP